MASVAEAKKKLSKLLDLALAAEEVTLTLGGEEIATVPKRPRPTEFGPKWFEAHRVVPADRAPNSAPPN